MKRQSPQQSAGKERREHSVGSDAAGEKKGGKPSRKKDTTIVVKATVAKRAGISISNVKPGLKTTNSKKRLGFSYQRIGAKSTLELIEAVRTGIPFAEFQELEKSMPFTMERWSEYLHVSVRTLQRVRKDASAFQALQAERIVEIFMLYKHGLDVFSNQDKLNKWLQTRTAALGGKAPQDLLDTKLGVGLVNDELGRIEHGILA